MSFDFFGRSFHFLADNLQREKAWIMLSKYIFKPQIIIMICVLLVYLFLRVVSKYKNKELNLILKKISHWVYLFVILSLTVFNRESGMRIIRWIPDPWFTATGFHESNVLGFLFNLFLYVPLGYLSYKFGFKSRKVTPTVVLVAVSSFAIETLQYILARGVTAIDDLFANTIGGLIGLGVAVAMKQILDKSKR